MQMLNPAKWIFFQTRWPPLLAPQQVLDLEKNYPARIPPWKGSTSRLAKDVILFCRQHPKSDCLLLLDPLCALNWAKSCQIESAGSKADVDSAGEIPFCFTSTLWTIRTKKNASGSIAGPIALVAGAQRS
ncbi:unnamed protein product, partial [Dibothriocephalus latus]